MQFSKNQDIVGTGGPEIDPKLAENEKKLDKEKQELNFEDFKLSQDFESMAGVRKEILTIPVRKPDRQSFIQVHPGVEWHMSALILEIKEDRENYLVLPNLIEALPEEFVPKYLFTCQTRQGVPFLWPVRMPGRDGRLDQWN